MNKLTALVEEMKYDSSGYAKAITELCALLEKAEVVLDSCSGNITPEWGYANEVEDAISESLAAIKQWKTG